MAEVKWIKIVTDVFDDEKILMIESMPEADSIIVIWFKLLCLAGKQNNSGVFQMCKGIAFTDEMFSVIFRRPLNTVRLALKAFEQFGMIEMINNTVTIPNWDKHQSLASYEKKKERDRLYHKERRAFQKALTEKSIDVSSDESIDVASQIREDKKRLEVDEEGEYISPATPTKPTKHIYGEYRNVRLTDDEVEKLKDKFPCDWVQRIENLSEGMARKGYKYKSHYLAILNWAKRDDEKPKRETSSNPFLDMLQEEQI